MDTRIIEGTDLAPKDADIAQLIDDATNPWGGGPHDSRIGVLNASGQLARVIVTAGMGEYMSVTNGLLRLGFKNLRPADSLTNIVRDGMSFDDVFSPG